MSADRSVHHFPPEDPRTTVDINDSFLIPAPRREVWDFLVDFERSALCMPGVVDLKVNEDDTFQGTLEVRVGPVAARFRGDGKIEEQTEPERFRATASGRDQLTGTSVQVIFDSRLHEVEQGTRIDYETDVRIRGKLAQFGQGVIKATAEQMTHQFVANLTHALTGEATPRGQRSVGRIVFDSLRGKGRDSDR